MQKPMEQQKSAQLVQEVEPEQGPTQMSPPP